MDGLSLENIKSILEKKIVEWRKKLLDLTKRNRLISFRDFKGSSLFFSSNELVKMFDATREGKMISIFKIEEDIKDENKLDLEQISDGTELSSESNMPPTQADEFDPSVWVPDYDNNETEKRLYSLFLSSRESLREQGINTLFIAFGFLQYFEADASDKELMAPLLLVPVEIEVKNQLSKNKHKYLIKYVDEEVQINPALDRKLLSEFDIKLPEYNDEKSLEDWLIEVEKVISGQPKWKISRRVCLGIFNFLKLQLYLDLEKFKELIFNSAVLQVLAGAPVALISNSSNNVKDDEIDDKIEPSQVFQVMEADSSQQESIEMAKRGNSLVIQGPPGTGKSQTIVNIVAELLAQGKKVLFVSEKMAALQVVKDRLDRVGLGSYCLELHSNKANKKDVLNQLEDQLNNKKRLEISKTETDDEYFSLLKSEIKELNLYGKEILMRRGAVELSIYETRGELLKLINLPDIDFQVNNALDITKTELAQKENYLSQLQAYKDEVNSYPTNAWRFFTCRQLTTEINNKTKQIVSELLSDYKPTSLLIKGLHKSFGEFEETLDNVKCTGELIDKISTRPNGVVIYKNWITSDVQEDLENVQQISNNLEKIIGDTKLLKDFYVDEYFDIPAEKYLEEYKKEYSSILRFVKSDYWKSRKFLLNFSKVKRTYSDIKSNLQMLVDIKTLIKENSALLEKTKDTLGENYQENSTQWIKVIETLKWSQDIRNYVLQNKGISLNDTFLSSLIKKDDDENNFKNYSDIYTEHFEKHLVDLLSFFSPDLNVNQKPLNDAIIKEIFEWVSQLNEHFGDLRNWVEFANLLEDANDDIKKYTNNFLVDVHNVENIILCYRKKFFQAFLNETENQITQKSGKYYDHQIELFRNKDSKQTAIARKRLIEILESKKPTFDLSAGYGSSELSILRHEILKKRNNKPLRDLFTQIPNLLFALKPCFLMSPLSVCHYIDISKLNPFDVVIFDEASQVMMEDSVSSLVRAKQAIILGDSQQLPPTNFFSRIEDNEDLDEDLQDLESILDEASSKFPNSNLLWHYRSRDESLIAFSNRHFYKNRLVTFPNNQILDKMGVEFVFVKNGIYDRGGAKNNVQEAKEVVALVEKHIKDNLALSQIERKSLGVVAFSMSQQHAIQEQIEMLKTKHPEYLEFFQENVLDEFFVKNLENVQGDERDVMIFSIGYGPDEAGKITSNFGPINKEGGYRRLNVAITRAREKIFLVASFQPEVINVNDNLNKGVHFLLEYMKYARDGVDSLKRELDIENLPLESPFEEEVYSKLIGQKYEVVPQVGCSGYRIDLAIKHPTEKGRFILGIECDGCAYHSSKTARDRDRLRQDILVGLGWKIHRIWSSDWFSDPETEIEKINLEVSKILSGEEPKKKDFETNIIQEIIEPNNHKANYPGYIITDTSKHSGSSQDIEFTYNNKLSQFVLDIIKTESPICEELVFKRVSSAWNITRIGKSVRNRILGCINGLSKKSYDPNAEVLIDGNLLWYKQSEEFPKIRISKESERPANLIPVPELASLALSILKNEFSISQDDLVTCMSRIYGFSRTGPSIKEHFSEVVKYLVEKKQIVKEGNKTGSKGSESLKLIS